MISKEVNIIEIVKVSGTIFIEENFEIVSKDAIAARK